MEEFFPIIAIIIFYVVSYLFNSLTGKKDEDPDAPPSSTNPIDELLKKLRQEQAEEEYKEEPQEFKPAPESFTKTYDLPTKNEEKPETVFSYDAPSYVESESDNLGAQKVRSVVIPTSAKLASRKKKKRRFKFNGRDAIIYQIIMERKHF